MKLFNDIELMYYCFEFFNSSLKQQKNNDFNLTNIIHIIMCIKSPKNTREKNIFIF